MLKEETAVLRAAYAYADALKHLNKGHTPEALRAYREALNNLALVAAELMDVPRKERSAK